jgi:hypothetical protein
MEDLEYVAATVMHGIARVVMTAMASGAATGSNPLTCGRKAAGQVEMTPA